MLQKGFGFQGTLLLCLAGEFMAFPQVQCRYHIFSSVLYALTGTHSLKSDDACLYLQSILGASLDGQMQVALRVS